MNASVRTKTFVRSITNTYYDAKEKLPVWAKIAGYFFSAALLFIGGRFLIAPELAERGFGLIYAQPSESFHYIKGIRDTTSGLFFLIFTVANWRNLLAVLFLAGSLIAKCYLFSIPRLMKQNRRGTTTNPVI